MIIRHVLLHGRLFELQMSIEYYVIKLRAETWQDQESKDVFWEYLDSRKILCD